MCALLAQALVQLLTAPESIANLSTHEVARVRSEYRVAVEKINKLPERPDLPTEIAEEEVDVFPARNLDGEQIMAGNDDKLVFRLDRKTFQLRLIKNDRLHQKYWLAAQELSKKERDRGVPELSSQLRFRRMGLSIEGAIAKAEDYLRHFGIVLPPSYRLARASFGIENSRTSISRW